jgi:hypothetical protein
MGRVFSEVPFWNSADRQFYTELTLFRVIPLIFFTVQYHEIPRNSGEFRKGSCIRNSVYLQM